MFKHLGLLVKYWHIIAFSSEIKKNTSIQKMMYSFPFLLWRDDNDNIHAIANVCAHKRAPLHVSDYKANVLTCPYHGWKYNSKGCLEEIPSSPHIDIQKLNCSLNKYEIIEQDGFVWIYLDDSQKANTKPYQFETQNWDAIFLKECFETTDELLVENFMDATHTAFTHKGIIRGMGEKVQHQLHVQYAENEVKVAFKETQEKVALGLNLILGNKLISKHTDAFLMPNLVKVDYYINDIHRFNAFIACTPVSEGKTMAYIKLSYNFKAFNPIIKLVLPFLARKVVAQDVEITKLQYANQQLFASQKDQCIDYDIIYNKIKLIRQSAINNTPVNAGETNVSIYL